MSERERAEAWVREQFDKVDRHITAEGGAAYGDYMRMLSDMSYNELLRTWEERRRGW